MAGKAKSCYLSVTQIDTRKTVLNRMFFKMADLNDFVKTDEFKVAINSINIWSIFTRKYLIKNF